LDGRLQAPKTTSKISSKRKTTWKTTEETIVDVNGETETGHPGLFVMECDYDDYAVCCPLQNGALFEVTMAHLTIL
jgi:hypothetical protein